MTIRAYNIKRRIMVSEREGDLYRHVGDAASLIAARAAVKRIERGELPADVLADRRKDST